MPKPENIIRMGDLRLSRYQMLHAKKIDNIFQRNILSVVILFYKRRYKIQNAGISPFKSVSHWNFTAA